MPADDDDLRALWQSQPTTLPNVSLDEVKKREAKLARTVRRRNAVEYAAAGLVTVIFGAGAVAMPVSSSRSTLLLRLACIVIVAATVYVVYRLRRDGSVLPPPAPDATLAEHLAHHRASLVRQRDLLRTVWLWYIAPLFGAILFFYLAMAVTLSSKLTLGVILLGMAKPFGATVLFNLFLVWANARAAKKLGGAISALDA